MSDQTGYDDETQDEPQGIKDLRDAAERGAAHQREAEAAKRELAFVKAGIDTDTKRGKRFADSYDGDLTVEAIKADYADLFGPDTPVTPEVTEDRDSAAAREALASETRERRDLANGASTTPPPTIDPRLAAREQFTEDVANGMRREDAAAGVLAASIAASNAGVKGATVD